MQGNGGVGGARLVEKHEQSTTYTVELFYDFIKLPEYSMSS
jgi:hypothetical protein